jgi:hypothetical protein
LSVAEQPVDCVAREWAHQIPPDDASDGGLPTRFHPSSFSGNDVLVRINYAGEVVAAVDYRDKTICRVWFAGRGLI